MKTLFPNLKKYYIEDLFFTARIEGNIKSIEHFWKSREFIDNVKNNRILILNEYSCDKTPHLIVLHTHPAGKTKNRIVLHISITTDSHIDKGMKKMKSLSPVDFLDFFKWLLKNQELKTSKISMLTHCQLPLKGKYSYPGLIDTDNEKPLQIVGLRYGFPGDLSIDTIIIEKTKNKKYPIHFMMDTLPMFRFNKKVFNSKFFDSPIEFVQGIISIFCIKK